MPWLARVLELAELRVMLFLIGDTGARGSGRDLHATVMQLSDLTQPVVPVVRQRHHNHLAASAAAWIGKRAREASEAHSQSRPGLLSPSRSPSRSLGDPLRSLASRVLEHPPSVLRSGRAVERSVMFLFFGHDRKNAQCGHHGRPVSLAGGSNAEQNRGYAARQGKDRVDGSPVGPSPTTPDVTLEAPKTLLLGARCQGVRTPSVATTAGGVRLSGAAGSLAPPDSR
jgi:hypothetical protein